VKREGVDIARPISLVDATPVLHDQAQLGLNPARLIG